MVFPVENYKGDSPAEDVVWALAKRAIPRESLSFHNYHLETLTPDVIIITPNRGVLIIEVKGFLAKNIKSVPDSTLIKFFNAPAKGSPFNQAIQYRNKLINMMGNEPNLDPAFIAVAVCYPFINRADFLEKMLYKISLEELTILEEDLASENAFNEKIERIYDYAYQSMGLHFGQMQFEGEEVKNLAYLFAPDFDKDIEDVKVEPLKPESLPIPVHVDYYSKLITFAHSVDRCKVERLLDEWFLGGKLYLFFADETDYTWFHSIVKQKLNEKGKARYKNFKEVSENMPNLVFSHIQELTSNIVIINGEEFEKYDEVLKIIDEESLFNYQQYKVEHADTRDIIVKAGAGTGKTSSMLSRINYLIWKHQYDAAELVNRIAMITFTNEAAREMKEKLASYFYDRFVLTTDILFLEYMEAAENMRISTIHSMAKEIIKKYSSKLGLGSNFKISGSNYEKRKKIHAALNEYISVTGNTEVGMPLYLMENRIESFTEQVENKNIDLSENSKLDFGEELSVNGSFRFADLLPAISKAKHDFREECKENNKIALSDIIQQLDMLTSKIKDQGGIIDYLFVDEFQDTDDVQIGLIAKYKNIFSLKLFVVGDVKQCIYRFRGADDAAFELLKDKIKTDVIEIELKKNYRTDKLLLNRMNKVFTAWNQNGDIVYGEQDCLIGTKNYNLSDSYYKFIFSSEDERNRMVVENIKKIQEEHPGESIAVLVRTNYQVLEFKEICESLDLRVETTVGGNLYKIEPALDLLKLLHALKYHQSPKDIYGLYTTSYVSESLDKIDIDSLLRENKLDYFKKKTPKSLKKWDSYIKRLHLEPVLKVVRDLIDDAKPWSIFASKLGGTKEEQQANKNYYLINLDQIFENISLSSNSNYLTLNSLIEYMEIMILTKQEEEERESIIGNTSGNVPICTTIHKAKGLEYDHVIFPYCLYDVSSAKKKGDADIICIGNKVGYSVKGLDFKMPPFANNYYKQFRKIEFEHRRKEEIRILYVAMTRAKKSLTYYIDDETKRDKALMNWKAMLKIGD